MPGAVRTIELLSAELDSGVSPPMWRVGQLVTYADGTRQQLLYLLPHDTLEWRCAEYGYDPDTDLEEVLDAVMLEPHEVEGQDGDDPDLFGADTTEIARTRHRRRHRKHRNKVRDSLVSAPVVVPGVPDVITAGLTAKQALLAHSPISRAHLEVKAEHVREVRARDRQQRRERPERPGRPDAQQLRRQLRREDGRPRTEQG